MKPQVKNIQLVSPDNPFYRLFQSKFKSEKPQKEVLSQKIVKKSQTISFVLETVTREWIKSSRIMQEERIIMYEEHYGKNNFRRLFKELDYVLKQGNKLIIGELKVSNSNPRGTASKQTFLSSELIKHISKSFDIQIIWVDLCPKYQKEVVSEFNPVFLKSNFQEIDYTEDRYTYNHKFKILHIDAKDIFDWGVKHNLIKTPQLLLAALEESDIVGKIHLQKQQINLLRKEIKDNPETEHTNIEKQIFDIQQNVGIEKAQLEIIQKGWTVQNKELEQLILNDNQTVYHSEKDYCTDFQTENQSIKYLVFQNPYQTEIHLLDAEKVYHRLSEQCMKEIETVLVQYDTDKFPIISNEGRRKFAYNYAKIDNSQKDIGGLIEFKQVVDNSKPVKIILKGNEVLIINNHKMLHKIAQINYIHRDTLEIV